ncbi:hypothetical protein MTO96_024665 [Rhipicephalus appendiculatus]
MGIGDYVAASQIFALVGRALTSYNPVLNVISISVAALRPPFYYGEATSAMFYGGLGFIYAEGIFRAVDMMSHLLNGGTVMAPSESPVTWAFWNASWCSDVQEAERTFPFLPALDVAYTAYLRFKDEASDLPLKGLREYSPTQVFFATFCHGTCWTDSSKRKFSKVCTDVTKNFGPFKESFSCATDATAEMCASPLDKAARAARKRLPGTNFRLPAASDVKPDGSGHSSDRDADRASKSSDSLRAAQDAPAKRPRLRRRASSTVPVPPQPNESNDLSSASRRRGAVRRHQRTSEVVPPYSPGVREPVAAALVAITATDGTGQVPEQPREPRRSTATGPATYGGTPRQASSAPKTMKEEPVVLTSDVDKAMDAPSDGRQRAGGPGRETACSRQPQRRCRDKSQCSVHLEGTSEYCKDASEAGRRSAPALPACPTAVHFGTWQSGLQPRHAFRAVVAIGYGDGIGAAVAKGHKVDGRDADLCGTADCIQHVHTLGIGTGNSASPCECFGCFVCSGWSNDFRHVNTSVKEQAILRWFATVDKLSIGDYDRRAVINRPLSMMRHCMSSTSDAEETVRMLTAFVSERSFAWPTPGEPDEVVDYGRVLKVVLELSVVWALPLWFHVHLLPPAATARLQRDRAVLLSPSTPSLLGYFMHDMISRYQDGYSIYTGFFIDTVFAIRPPSEAFATFLTTRSSVVQGQIFHALTSAVNNRLPQPRLVKIGSMPKLVRNMTAEDWITALRSVYGTSAEDITANDLVLATNGGLIKAIDSIFASNTAQDVFFHTIWWFVQAVGATISSVLRLSVNSVPEGVYFQRLICFYHVDTTYNVLLASINKAMLSTDARLAITSRLENIRSVVVEKLRAYSKLNAETRRALSEVVESMSTVIWPDDDFGRPGGFEQYFGEPYNGSDGGFYAEWEWIRLQMYNRHNRTAVAIGDYVAASKVFAFAGETVTAYNPLLNVISISIAALSPPFYYREATSAMFYGGLGFIYAEGNLQGWWT